MGYSTYDDGVLSQAKYQICQRVDTGVLGALQTTVREPTKVWSWLVKSLHGPQVDT